MNVIFDIETGPLPIERIKEILPPFDPESLGKHPGKFNPKSVKLGRMVDEKKIAAKIADAEEKHAEAVKSFDEKLASGEVNHWASIMEKAALSAITGQVVAIGYGGKKRISHLAVGPVSERDLLERFWDSYRAFRKEGRKMIGFRCKTFDVPFIAQRSRILGVPVPDSLLTPTGFLDGTFVDLYEIWHAGDRRGGQFPGYSTLDVIAKACGLPPKFSGASGKDFARLLWSDDPADQKAARDYLDGDIVTTEAIAERFGCR